jgi:hypothetical protein
MHLDAAEAGGESVTRRVSVLLDDARYLFRLSSARGVGIGSKPLSANACASGLMASPGLTAAARPNAATEMERLKKHPK